MMPVSAYYFHIAPVYFLISGLIATPAALAIFSLTLVFFLEQFIFSGASNISGYALDFVSRMFLDSNTFIESLPFSTFSNIWITRLGLMLIIVTVLIFSIALLSGRKSFIFYGLMMVLIMTGHHYSHQSKLDRHQEICIYSTRKDLAIDLFTNRICYSIQSDTLSQINEDFVYKNHRMKNGIEKVIQIGLAENYEDQNISLKDGVLSMNNCRITIYPMNKAFMKDVETQSKGHQYQRNLSDVKQINLKGNYQDELKDILLVFDPEGFVDSIKEKDFNSMVVLPGHLPFWEAKAIKKLLLNKAIWDIREKGALSIVWE
jgi:hypothetical protein